MQQALFFSNVSEVNMSLEKFIYVPELKNKLSATAAYVFGVERKCKTAFYPFFIIL